MFIAHSPGAHVRVLAQLTRTELLNKRVFRQREEKWRVQNRTAYLHIHVHFLLVRINRKQFRKRATGSGNLPLRRWLSAPEPPVLLPLTSKSGGCFPLLLLEPSCAAEDRSPRLMHSVLSCCRCNERQLGAGGTFLHCDNQRPGRPAAQG